MLKPLKPKRTSGAGFVHVLWNILTNEDPSIISWNNGGASFSIHDTEKFEQATLPRNQLPNLCTFRHFLHAHGFKEVSENQHRDEEGKKGAETYRHDDFVAGHLDKLDRITFDDSVKLILCQECKLNEQSSRCSARRHTAKKGSQSSTTAWNQPPQAQASITRDQSNDLQVSASRQPPPSSSDMRVGQTLETLQVASAPQNSFITSRTRTTHAVQYPRAVSTDQFSSNYSSTTSDRPRQRIDPFPNHLLKEQPSAPTSRAHPAGEFSRNGSERTMEKSWSTHRSTIPSSSPSSLIAGFTRNQTLPSTTQSTQLSTRLATKTTTGLAVLPSFQAPMSVTLRIGGRKRGKQSSGIFGFEQQSEQQKRMRLSPRNKTAERDATNPLITEWNGSGERSNQTIRTSAATERTVETPPTQHRLFSEKPVAGWTHAGHSSDGHHNPAAPKQSNAYLQPIPRLPSMPSQHSSYTTVPIHTSNGRASSNDDLAGNRKNKASNGTSSPRGVYAPSLSPGNGKSPSTESEEDGLSLLMLASAPR
uniref:HSF-type DNA-binding domain-containing protein n=1 Tax=Globisporangium ultimum (strain ATCC 200006 / CBS 805.95 / DAOM BR144) TaxID=431595 RepID=K3WFW2_GLOUD